MADQVPPNLTTPVGQVRLLIPDMKQIPDQEITAGVTYMIGDDAIQALLDLPSNHGSVLLAASMACQILAMDDLMIGKVIITSDLATDASKVAAQFMARAAMLEAKAIRNGESPDLNGEDDLIVTAAPTANWSYWPELVPHEFLLGY